MAKNASIYVFHADTEGLNEKYCDVIVKRYIEQTGNADNVFLYRDGLEFRYSDISEKNSTYIK